MMNTLFVVVIIFSALVLAGWLMIPVAIVMLDSDEADSWNGRDE